MKIIDLLTTSTKSIIAQTIAILQSGGLILFPTETTYGAGVDATNQLAVDKLLSYKSRREGKPLSVIVADETMAGEYVEINDQAHSLYSQFLPGPVTVVSKNLGTPDKNGNSIAYGVASEFGTLGIRIPDYDLMLKISKAFGKPITATSANASGEKRPYSIDDILSGLSEKQKKLIDLVLNAGELPKNEPSTVIDATLSAPVTLRKSNREIENVIASANRSSKKTDNALTLFSKSEQETKSIAGRLLLKHWDNITTTGIVIALDGDLGVGKTIFTKGSAEFLKIEDIIKSPTYTYIEEYNFTRHQTTGKLFHLDMWKVADKTMFERLEIEKLFGKNHVIIIEWFSQVVNYIQPLLENTVIVKIKIAETGRNAQSRKLEIIE